MPVKFVFFFQQRIPFFLCKVIHDRDREMSVFLFYVIGTERDSGMPPLQYVPMLYRHMMHLVVFQLLEKLVFFAEYRR
jgi:hypothetical protein